MFRHEVKHEISRHDVLILRQRLRAVMKPDQHAQNGRYIIRSLYFDSPDDKALREKLDGVNGREKYRIRLYNRDASVINLERKYKLGGLGCKQSAELSPVMAEAAAHGDFAWMAQSNNEVIRGFFEKIQHQNLRPRVIVDYTREPFIFSAGNVRVTVDTDIRTGLRCTDLLNFDCPTVPVQGDPCILEVKWDGYLPDVIRDAVQLDGRHAAAYSKYAACRAFD